MSKMTANDARGEVGGGVKEISEQTGIERRVIIDWIVRPEESINTSHGVTSRHTSQIWSAGDTEVAIQRDNEF